MPIIRSSDQKNKTLVEFYQDLSSGESSFYTEIGATMLSFIDMVNQIFLKTTLYGLTSHERLIIQSADSWQNEWYITVYSIGDGKFQFEYKMPNNISPWKYAIISGQANSIEEAKEYLIIAMTECGGWEGNKELRKLHNKLKKRPDKVTEFKLWLEFEEVDPNNWDIENEFCNVIVDLPDGRHYGINVWTYKFLETSINDDKEDGKNLNGLYQKPPDLFVKELSRECLEKTIADLLKIGDLEKVLNPTVYSKNVINKIKAIKIQITSFISDYEPGIVECKFTDAWNKEHIFYEKIPIVTEKDLDINSAYPQEGIIACEIIREWKDKDERTIFRVTTDEPWSIDSIDGLTEFDLLEGQLTDIS